MTDPLTFRTRDLGLAAYLATCRFGPAAVEGGPVVTFTFTARNALTLASIEREALRYFGDETAVNARHLAVCMRGLKRSVSAHLSKRGA